MERQWSTMAGIILMGGGLFPGNLMAQPGFFVIPSLSVMEIYDDNIFFSASRQHEDFISRFSPAVVAGYRSAPVTLETRHTFDAEAYARHPELNAADVRQHSAVDFQYRPTRLLTLKADASRTETQRPGELAGDTGLELGRARAERVAAGVSLSYRIDPRTDANASYDFTQDDLAGAIETDTRTAELSLERRVTRRSTMSLGYTARRFLFDGEDTSTSHVATLGWTYEMTSRTSLALVGGPRFSNGAVDPEISATIDHTLERGRLSSTYARSESAVIGQADTVTTESLRITAVYSPTASLEIRAVPSFANNTRGAGKTKVYGVNLEASYRINKYMSMTGSYRSNLQQGSLDDSSDEEITRNIVLVGVTLSHPSWVDSGSE